MWQSFVLGLGILPQEKLESLETIQESKEIKVLKM